MEIPATTGAMPALEIEEVVFLADKTKVVFTRPNAEGVERLSIESPVQMSRDFALARKALEALAHDLLEVPPRSVNRLEIRSVVFKRNSDEQPGAVIKAFRYYAEHLGGLALNTPVVFLGDSNPARAIQPDKWALLDALRKEAEAYVDGKLDAQTDLFAGDGATTPEPLRPEKTAGRKTASPTIDGAPDGPPETTAKAPKTTAAKTADKPPAKPKRTPKPKAPVESDADFDDGGAGVAKVKAKAGA